MLPFYDIEFVNTASGTSTSLRAYSHYTGIVGESGEHKTHFIKFIDSLRAAGVFELRVNGETGMSLFTLSDSVGENLLPALQSGTRSIMLIDEITMLRSGIVKAVNESTSLILGVTRGFPLRSDCPVFGIYRVNTYESEGVLNFELVEAEPLPVAKDFSMMFDYIVTESRKGRSENELLSAYIDNVIGVGGRDRLSSKISKLSGRILVLADLSSIGKAYDVLLERCHENHDLVFYDYMCFEELLFCSKLLDGDFADLDMFSELNIDRVFEHYLESKTKGAELRYVHKEPLSKVWLSKDSFMKVFDSSVGKGLRSYIERFGKI